MTAAVVFAAAGRAYAEVPGHEDSPSEPVQPVPPIDSVSTTATADHAPSPGQRLSPRADVVLASISNVHSGAYNVQDLKLKAAAPLARGNGYGLALLLNYDATRIDTPGPMTTDRLTLHRFEAMLGGGVGVAPGWSLRGSFGVSHSSDLEATTWQAVEVTSTAMLHHVITPSDAIVFGVVYTSTAQLFPVLPLLGYVHQAEGSPFRLDIFLPHHVRAEYALLHRLRGALGLEAAGDTWTVHLAKTRGEQLATREGGAVFAELSLLATNMVHVEARAGMSVDRYEIPTATDTMPHDQPLRAASFAQLQVVVAP
ncbi:MAG TPA: hypothetical protein VFP84_02980 [Kofleriaceae bacterium]|nr:hypothetical protein [Kofleriaceae bacterium]